MDYNSIEDYLIVVASIMNNNTCEAYTSCLPSSTIYTLLKFMVPMYRSELQAIYSEPMLWIGLYIALASLLCILAMLADFLHGFRNRKFWIPSKYFSINAASLTVISVAMKLPVDLSGAMPGGVDQAAKLGSMAFMCTMMANLLPSLASMDNNQLLTNITALGILVITLVVNVCIQITTGVISINDSTKLKDKYSQVFNRFVSRIKFLNYQFSTNKRRNSKIAIVYVTILLLLLIIHVCSSLAILKSKQIIESKYKKRRHETASEQLPSPAEALLSVEKLRQHVRNYWIMAGSGSPEFIAACSVTTIASGVICVVPTVLHSLTMSWTIEDMLEKDFDSDYKWSMLVILIVQFIGVIVGTIAPFCRCFATLSFKVSNKSISNGIKVFKVESYWTSKLYEWKQGSMSHNLKGVIHYSRNLILKFCIEIQKTVVVMCKLIAVVPFFLMICVWYCFHCLKWLLKTALFRSSRQKFETLEQYKDLTRYVLQLEDEMELAERTLEGLTETVNHLIQKGENKQPRNLNSLIAKNSTTGFQQVLLSKENQDCWSLSVVTLTTIALSLPDIEKEQVDSLLKSVREGLKYITLVENSLLINVATGHDYASVRKAADALWPEVCFHRKWLGNELQKAPASSTCDQVDKTRRVIEWFRDTAKKMVTPAVGSTNIGGLNDDDSIVLNSICANSMYRVTETLLLSYQASTSITDVDDKVSRKSLFDQLSEMIADVIGASLTNLPQVIVMKCHTSPIEKREASVRAAALLLGETKQIIIDVQKRQPLDMKTNDLPFIGKWRVDLRNP